MTTKAQAVAQWKEMQNLPQDLREFAYEWRKENKSREFLASVFDFDTTKSMKWWDDLVVEIETKLEELSNDDTLPPLTVYHFRVASFKEVAGKKREDITVFDYGSDFEGAKAWASKLYQEITGGCKTQAFENRTLEEMYEAVEQTNGSDFIVFYANMGMGVHITMVPVAI